MLFRLFALTALLAIGGSDATFGSCPRTDYVSCPAANAADPVLASFDVSRPWTVILAPVTIRYPSAGTTPAPTATISCIRVTNLSPSGTNDGVATLQSGGVGQTSVTLLLKHCAWRGLNFRVEILGQ